MGIAKDDFPGKFLLPPGFRITGLVLALAGILTGFLRFSRGIKPAFLDVKVFAVYSVYFDTKYFSIIGNNISEEVCGLLLLSGLFFMTFARERKELPGLWFVRIRAFLLAFYVNTVFLVVSFIFVYGLGFVFILSFNLFSFMLFYNILFAFYRYKHRNSFPD